MPGLLTFFADKNTKMCVLFQSHETQNSWTFAPDFIQGVRVKWVSRTAQPLKAAIKETQCFTNAMQVIISNVTDITSHLKDVQICTFRRLKLKPHLQIFIKCVDVKLDRAGHICKPLIFFDLRNGLLFLLFSFFTVILSSQ